MMRRRPGTTQVARAGGRAHALGAGAVLAASLLAASLLAGRRAAAHEVGLSKGDYVVEGARVRAQVIFARRELINLVAGLDADHDGAVTDKEIAAARDAVEGAIVGRVKVTGDGAPCPGSLDRVELTEADGIAVRAVYACTRRPRQLAVALTFLDDVAAGHRHLARVSAGSASIDRVLSQRNPALTFDVPPGPDGPAPGSTSTSPISPATSPLRSGAIHVLARPDAPAFLLAILVTCAGRRAALLAALAFAAAVLVGLALGAAGLFVPGPRVLGPAIALSLIYAGLDALTAPDGATRWRTALPFGLVHGLGCAAALTALAAPSAAGAPAPGVLAAFGAGVALALAAVSAVLVPAIGWARRRPAWPARLARTGALIAAAAGALELLMART